MTKDKIAAVNKRLARGYVEFEHDCFFFYEKETGEQIAASQKGTHDHAGHPKFTYYWMQATIDDALEKKYGITIK